MLQEVREIIALLMKRPITEAVVMRVKSIPGYKQLTIQNGEWVGLDQEGWEKLTAGEEHGWIETLLLMLIANYVLANQLGHVYPGNTTYVLEGTPGNIITSAEPDVSFVAAANVTPSSGFIYRAPDLAIEIKSPSQSYSEMLDKIALYFQYGTKEVWLVLPKSKAIEVHRPNVEMSKHGLGEQVSGSHLLPGFVLDVNAVFGN